MFFLTQNSEGLRGRCKENGKIDEEKFYKCNEILIREMICNLGDKIQLAGKYDVGWNDRSQTTPQDKD
jgi:hypothetical protein